MYLEFHHRDWIALINKILKSSGHQRIHIKNVYGVDKTQVCFVTTQGAHIVAPTFTTIHGHGIGFLSLLRVLHHHDSVTWEPLTGSPTHNAKLIVLNHHNFTPVLYPSLAQLDHWLVRQYQQDAQFHIEPFHDDIAAGLIAEHPKIIDIQRRLSYSII